MDIITRLKIEARRELTTRKEMMANLIPETITRLQAVAFVQNAEISAVGRSAIIRMGAEKMAETALRELLDNCIKSEGDYMGYQGQTLKLDVYVISPDELHQMIARAREQGEQDAMRWKVLND